MYYKNRGVVSGPVGQEAQPALPRALNYEVENQQETAFSQSLVFDFCFLPLPTLGGWWPPLSPWVFISWVETTSNDCLLFLSPASAFLRESDCPYVSQVFIPCLISWILGGWIRQDKHDCKGKIPREEIGGGKPQTSFILSYFTS